MIIGSCTTRALQERRDAYRQGPASRVTLRDAVGAAQGNPGCCRSRRRWSFSSQQATLRRLNLAMQAFFRRVKAGQSPGYPRFGPGWFDTVVWPKDGDGCRWDSTPDDRRPGCICKVSGTSGSTSASARSAGRVKTISMKREGAAWYVVVACDDVPTQPLPAPTGRVTGVDVGVTRVRRARPTARLIANPAWWEAGRRAAHPPRSGNIACDIRGTRADPGAKPARRKRSRKSTAARPGNGWTSTTRPRWTWCAGST